MPSKNTKSHLKAEYNKWLESVRLARQISAPERVPRRKSPSPETEERFWYLWNDDVPARLAAGERQVIEDALALLESDLYYFRSGYLKSKVLLRLRKATLFDSDRERLRKLIVDICLGLKEIDFVKARRLSLYLWTPVWEEELRQQNSATNGGGWNRLARLLEYLESNRWNIEELRRPLP